MAIGDAAKAAGYTLVPESGEDGRVRWGARELNRTRDFIAGVKNLIPVGKGGFRTATGIYSGTSNPSNTLGANGDVYFKIL